MGVDRAADAHLLRESRGARAARLLTGPAAQAGARHVRAALAAVRRRPPGVRRRRAGRHCAGRPRARGAAARALGRVCGCRAGRDAPARAGRRGHASLGHARRAAGHAAVGLPFGLHQG
eukprot:scaffold113112_cov62-Phaeocystis_antarctica.AAC.6